MKEEPQSDIFFKSWTLTMKIDCLCIDLIEYWRKVAIAW